MRLLTEAIMAKEAPEKWEKYQPPKFRDQTSYNKATALFGLAPEERTPERLRGILGDGYAWLLEVPACDHCGQSFPMVIELQPNDDDNNGFCICSNCLNEAASLITAPPG